MGWNWQQEWFRIYLTSRISFSMDVLVSLQTTVLSTAVLLCWPWWCSPAQACLAERAFQCAAQEGREGAQGSGRGSGRTDPFGCPELLGQISLSVVMCVPAYSQACPQRYQGYQREPPVCKLTVRCQAQPHTTDVFFPSAEQGCPSVVWGGVSVVGASKPVDFWCSWYSSLTWVSLPPLLLAPTARTGWCWLGEVTQYRSSQSG